MADDSLGCGQLTLKFNNKSHVITLPQQSLQHLNVKLFLVSTKETPRIVNIINRRWWMGGFVMVKCSTGMLYGTRFEPLPAADGSKKSETYQVLQYWLKTV